MVYYAIRECKEEIGVIPKLSSNKDDYVVIDIKGGGRQIII
jgi:hypothetical protein